MSRAFRCAWPARCLYCCPQTSRAALDKFSQFQGARAARSASAQAGNYECHLLTKQQPAAAGKAGESAVQQRLTPAPTVRRPSSSSRKPYPKSRTTFEFLDTLKKQCCRARLTNLCTEHYVIQMPFGPLQPEVRLDEAARSLSVVSTCSIASCSGVPADTNLWIL
jgi:hypothetical protein